jgi:2-polyprenyl-3-methyl-5-hydroxy-6-metoxy-1,4-benzoquinol methylase
MPAWWETFFDDDYLHVWEGSEPPMRTEREVEALWRLLGLQAGSRVLDAPCGYGRISRGLAERGAIVVGVDVSGPLLAEAEGRRAGVPVERLEYLRHDLRERLPKAGFDVALNVFSSLGYGSEADDVAILETPREAVRPGGLVFVETMHRDLLVVTLASSSRRGRRLPDGTLVVEEIHLDPITGRADSSWFWNGPRGSGHKTASMRVYAPSELARLLAQAGLELVSAHDGCSADPFLPPGHHGGSGRLGLLARRP